MTHHPYLEITLARQPIGLEKERDVTCQSMLAQRRRKRKADARPNAESSDVPALPRPQQDKKATEQTVAVETPSKTAKKSKQDSKGAKGAAVTAGLDGIAGRGKTSEAPERKSTAKKRKSETPQGSSGGKRKKPSTPSKNAK